MATQTFQYSSFSDGLVRIEFDVNDANWRMTQVRCINNSQYSAKAKIYESGTLKFEATGPANSTTSWNTVGIQLTWDAVDGNLNLGSYEIHSGWPN